MKNSIKKHLLIALLAAVATQPDQLFAQTPAWQTVDTYPGAVDASAGDIGTDPSRVILYSVGSAAEVAGGPRSATIRGSTDRGLTWDTLDSFSPEGWPHAHYRGFASGPDGTLFAAGEVWDRASTKNWIVRKSVDYGVNWTPADTYSLQTCPSAVDVKVAASGDIYVTGTTGPSFQWLVRKSSDNGTTWASVDLAGTGQSEGRAIAFTSGGGVLVAGAIGYPAVWTVRRSLNAGTTWTTVDSYRESNGLAAEPLAMVADSAGAIYVAGFARGAVRKNYVDYWVVRRSLNGGSTWTTIDKSSSAGLFLSATGITVDQAGRVWVCGYIRQNTSSTAIDWLVRKGTRGANGVFTWANSDSYRLVSGQDARANSVTSDAFGNIFVTGRANDAMGVTHYTTRKLPAQ